MPSDALTVAVTTGLGVSVLAGLISGICYILTHGIPHTRIPKPITPWHCNVCGEQFRSIQGILEVEKVATCAKCKVKVCRIKCSRRDSQRGWICQICQQPENWFKGLLKSIHPNKDRSRMDSVPVDALDEDLMELRKKEREQVRDFIERLVESMLGGNLDDITVSRIYNDKKYDSLFARYHSDLSNALTDLGSALQISISNLPITGQSPCSAHAYLKQIIERFANEATELPSLRSHEDHPAHPEESLSSRTYEDLLSTAIINKVVQVNQNDRKSSTNSNRASTASRNSGNKEYFFGEETLGSKWKSHDSIRDDASSVSSLDEWVRSDSSVGSSKYVDRVSLTIKQQIEEDSSSDEETTDSGSQVQESSLLHSGDENWHENWYFQKRRLTNSSSPVPVPMLVPNPIQEAKVLIGDQEAEQLSDRDSDYGDPELVQDIKNILVNSKTIIGGKNPLPGLDEPDHAPHATVDILETKENRRLQATEDVRNIVETSNIQESPQATIDGIEGITPYQDINDNAVEPIEVENYEQNFLNISEPNNEDISLTSIESNTEQDTEYTEQYASLTRTFLKTAVPVPRNPQVAGHYAQDAIKLLENGFKHKIYENGNCKSRDDSDSDEEKMKIFKGSYSEREKEKWKHSSVDIPDNPYSPANLERRLSSRSSNGSSSSIFGRDYYIKNAAKSAGARSPNKLLTESEITEYSSTVDRNESNSEDVITTVTAVPAVVNQEESIESESITETLITTPRPIITHDISSDSDLSIERVYNLQSGRVFETKGNIRQEIPATDSYSPEGLKYVPKKFDEDIASNIDDGYSNAAIESNKAAFMRSLTQDNEISEFSQSYYPNTDVIPIQDEVIDVVPYDENTFKATLEKFKLVTNISESNKNNEKSEVLNHTNSISSVEENKLVVEAVESIDTPNHHENISSIPINEIHEIQRSFGETKKIVDNNRINTSDYSEEDVLSESREFSLEYSTDINGDDISRAESSLEIDPEITDLKEKGLVTDILGKFSRSYSNISIVSIKQVEEQINYPEETESCIIKQSLVEEIDGIPSVKNLKQLFDKENNSPQMKKDPKQIYSLTARSLPKQFRQKLRSDEETSLDCEDNITEQRVADEEPEETLPIDIAKNRIAFYEHLGNNK